MKFRTLTLKNHIVSLNIENTMWANTVVASGTALGVVIYSGSSCRAVMGNKKGKSKSGIIDKEVNFLTFVSFRGFKKLCFYIIYLQRIFFSYFFLQQSACHLS